MASTTPSVTPDERPSSFTRTDVPALLEKDIQLSKGNAAERDLELSNGRPFPQHQEPALQRWNATKLSKFRFLVTLYCFIIMGMNDAAVGVSQALEMSTCGCTMLTR
jgi:hypothetical protein